LLFIDFSQFIPISRKDHQYFIVSVALCVVRIVMERKRKA